MPDVPGLDPKHNMKAYVDRKSFIHNFGHALCAYLGYLEDPELTTTGRRSSTRWSGRRCGRGCGSRRGR